MFITRNSERKSLNYDIWSCNCKKKSLNWEIIKVAIVKCKLNSNAEEKKSELQDINWELSDSLNLVHCKI